MVRAIRWPKIDLRLTPTPGRTSIGSLGMIMRLQHFGCKNRPLFHIQVTKVNPRKIRLAIILLILKFYRWKYVKIIANYFYVPCSTNFTCLLK
jgi:hypothetical protein